MTEERGGKGAGLDRGKNGTAEGGNHGLGDG